MVVVVGVIAIVGHPIDEEEGENFETPRPHLQFLLQDIKLFVKLPSWFEVDTPVGKYNPDWANPQARRPSVLPRARDEGHQRLFEASHE